MKTELLAIEALNVTFHSKTGPKKPLSQKAGSSDSKRQSGWDRRRIW